MVRRMGTPLPSHNSTLLTTQAHPKYGNILASSSYDGKVFIWREQNGQWQRVIDFALHTASVNLISWSPHEAGCLLACASSDGSVSVLDFKDSNAPAASAQTHGAAWDHKIFHAHGVGCNAVSWAPATLPGTLEKASATPGASPPAVRRFVTGGSDTLVCMWEFNAGSQSYDRLVTLRGHADWVRDVAWSPTVLSRSYVASASQDNTVRIWTIAAGQDPGVPENWACKVLEFPEVCWRVSWSLSGNVLAVSGGDNKVTLWKERVRDGEWECVKTIEE